MRCADEVTIVGHSVFVRGEIEYYGDEDVPPRAGHSPTECRLFVPEADIATTPDRKGAAMACLMAELLAGVSIVGVALMGLYLYHADPLRDELNRRFPPMPEATQRQEVLVATAEALSRMPQPNVAAGVRISDISALLDHDQLRLDGVTSITLIGDEQMLRVSMEFDRTWTGDEPEFKNQQDLREWLKRLKPRLKGKLTVLASLTAERVDDGPVPRLVVRLHPRLQHYSIKKLTLAERVETGGAVDKLLSVMRHYNDNLNGYLARQPWTEVTMDALQMKSTDLSQALKLPPQFGTGSASMTAQPVKTPLELDALAVLIDSDMLLAMAQLRPASKPRSEPIAIEPNFAAIRDHVYTIVGSSFQMNDLDERSWAGVRKDVVAFATTDLMRQANFCVVANGLSTAYEAQEKVKLPDGAGIECKRRKCEPRQCKFNAQQANYSCDECMHPKKACALGRCVRWGCARHWKNPVCEAGRAVLQTGYDRQADLEKAACDSQSIAELTACDIGAEAEVGLCKGVRGALDALSNTGNFANIKLNASLKAHDVRVCVRDFNLSNDLSRASMNLHVEGKAQLDTTLKFVPLDIVGHLTCPSEWAKSASITAKVSDQVLPITGAVELDTSMPEGPKAVVRTTKLTLKYKVSPSPTDLLLQSSDLAFKCPFVKPALLGLAPVAVTLTPFVPQLRGNFEHLIEPANVDVKLTLPKQKVLGGTVDVALEQSPTALVLAVKPQLRKVAVAR